MLEYKKMKIEHYDAAYKLWQECEEIELTIGDSKESLSKYLKNCSEKFSVLSFRLKELHDSNMYNFFT